MPRGKAEFSVMKPFDGGYKETTPEKFRIGSFVDDPVAPEPNPVRMDSEFGGLDNLTEHVEVKELEESLAVMKEFEAGEGLVVEKKIRAEDG